MKAADNHALKRNITIQCSRLGWRILTLAPPDDPEPKGGESHCGHIPSSR